MRKLFSLVIFLFFVLSLDAQIIDPGKAAKRAAENRANRNIERGIDGGLDKAEEGIGNIFKKKDKTSKKSDTKKSETSDNGDADDEADTNEESASNNKQKANEGSTNSFSSYGKFDFIPGENVIAFEDFSQDDLGDFPARWNTNGSGELVILNDNKTKFLRTEKEVVFYPEFVNNLPENFTVEFDLSSTPEYSYHSGFMKIGFTSDENVGGKWKTFSRHGIKSKDLKHLIEIGLHPNGPATNRGMTQMTSYTVGEEIIDQDDDQNAFKVHGQSTNVRVSIWRQKRRIRVYLNENKIWDIPRALADGATFNSLYFRNDGANYENQAYFISNLRVAVGAPDTRNKLITEGKFVTSGILFDVNSDKIKPESYGVLKDIATVLKENEDVKVKIVGHTDSDGEDSFNMTLSTKRAASVKNMLASEFGIKANRMTTEGKGESEPVSPNNTPEGKANNRRVEFIKL